MDGYFELAQGSSIRLCLALEKKHSAGLRGWHLELMMYLWLAAYESETYYGVCEDAWLRTTVGLVGSLDSIVSEDSPERILMSRLPKHLLLQLLSRMLLDPTAKMNIHSNILPRKAYREKLALELQRQSIWTRVQCLVRSSPCSGFRREFYPVRVFDEAQKGHLSLMEKMNAWRRDGGICDLAMHLQSSGVPLKRLREELRKKGLREISWNDVHLTTDSPLGAGGADGDVHKVSWHKGIYARKKFNQTETFERERRVAWKVLHPHIVHSFGYLHVPNANGSGYSCLLMEALSGDLHNFVIQNAKSAIRLPFSRGDALDVLLQIASAMEHMHFNDIVHGDLKSKNILVSHFEISGNIRHFLAKVTDFGNAQFVTSKGTFHPGFGTTLNAAPEMQRMKSNRYLRFSDSGLKKMDVYSFGAVAYEVLTGQEVYNGQLSKAQVAQVGTGELRPRYSRWQRMRTIGCPIDLLERCWEFDASKRPTFEDLRIALETSKSNMQRLEKNSAELWNFMAIFLISCLIFLLLCFVKFVLIMTLTMLSSAVMTRSS